MNELQVEFPGLIEQIDEIVAKADKQNKERKMKEDKIKVSKAIDEAVEFVGKSLGGKEQVVHPSHYNRPNGIECLKEMELVFGKEAVMTFCLLNTWKYRYRSADKNGQTDLEKSDFYMQYYKKLKTGIDDRMVKEIKKSLVSYND